MKKYKNFINEKFFQKKFKVGDYVIYNPPISQSPFVTYIYKDKIGKILGLRITNDSSYIEVPEGNNTSDPLYGKRKFEIARVDFSKSIKIDELNDKISIFEIPTNYLIKTNSIENIRKYDEEYKKMLTKGIIISEHGPYGEEDWNDE